MAKQLPVQGSVEILADDDTWRLATVVDLLDIQFTAEEWASEKIGFYYYTDKGTTWRQLQ